ncbi:MAG: CRTAC1 family protein [Saprospiraceae bacterium]|nr:CRTAC1 family protein [Saprospiraceae bacterium]
MIQFVYLVLFISVSNLFFSKKIDVWILLILSFYTHAQRVTFTEKTQLIQYVTGTMGQAKCAADMNGDGLDDITRVSKEGIFIDFQQIDCSFSSHFFPLEIKALPEWSITAGDINSDGLNDLLFGGVSKVSFVLSGVYRNQFIEKVASIPVTSQRSNFIDINQDGLLDAFVCNDIGKSIPFRNTGIEEMQIDFSLINTSELPGNYSSVWTDYNNDGKADLYVSKCLPNTLPGHPARTNLLYKNLGSNQFQEVGAQAHVDDNAQSWTSVFEDFDHDGDMDFLVINHDDNNRFYRNNGDGTFTDIIEFTGIDVFDPGAFEAVSGDFDNDGNPDIISELNKQLYLGNGDLTFFGQQLVFKPGAIGDFNNDGFLDITTRSQVWINDGNKNHFVKFMLKGWESNHNGIGAKILIRTGNKIQTRELRAGQSYSPMNTLNVHFGLGKDTIIDEVKIIWPSGIQTILLNVASDSLYTIAEGICSLPVTKILYDNINHMCPGKSKALKLPEAYSLYRWNNGFTENSIHISGPGLYYAMYRDSSGCTGLSDQVIIADPDNIQHTIEITEGDSINCTGEMVVISSSSARSVWSGGESGTEEITVTQNGEYFTQLILFALRELIFHAKFL